MTTPKPKSLEIKDLTNVSTSALLHITALSPATITKLLDKGVVKRKTRGRFDLPVFIQSYIRFLRHHHKTEVKDESQRLMKIRIEKQEIELAALKGEYLPRREVQALYNETMVIVGTRLDALAGRLSGELVNRNNAAEIREIIRDETNQVRSASASKLEELAHISARRRDTETTSEEIG